MAVPKKRTSVTKRIHKNFWKRKGYWTALKALSLGKTLYTSKNLHFDHIYA